jgi:hypothetical protein
MWMNSFLGSWGYLPSVLWIKFFGKGYNVYKWQGVVKLGYWVYRRYGKKPTS